MKKLNAILFVLGLVFLILLIAEFGARELWRGLISLGWGLVPFILVEGTQEFLHTVGWRQCLTGPYRAISWWKLFRIRVSGTAVNYLTPTASLGGEVTRAALLAGYHPGPGAVSAVLIEKVAFALGQVLFVAGGIFFIAGRVQLPHAVWMSMLGTGALMGGGVITFLWLQRKGKLGGFVRWVAGRKWGGRLMQNFAGNISEVDEALKTFYRERPWGLWLAVFLHIVGFSTGILQTWLFLYWTNSTASVSIAASAWVLGIWFDLLMFAVPLGAGTLEGARIVAFRAVGLSSLLGMTCGLALRITQLFWAGMGLLFYAFLASGDSGTRIAKLGRSEAATGR